MWSRVDSNYRPPPCRGGTLPLSYETRDVSRGDRRLLLAGSPCNRAIHLPPRETWTSYQRGVPGPLNPAARSGATQPSPCGPCSGPVNGSRIFPRRKNCREYPLRESNSQPAVCKTAALPIELKGLEADGLLIHAPVSQGPSRRSPSVSQHPSAVAPKGIEPLYLGLQPSALPTKLESQDAPCWRRTVQHAS